VSPKLNKNKAVHQNANEEKVISLHSEFYWYEKAFCETLSRAASEFLATEMSFKLAAASYTPPAVKDGSYFVTQIGLSKDHSLTMKISDSAANIIFRNALGDRAKETGYLQLKNITELEAAILTNLNEFLYKKISGNFLSPKEIKEKELQIDDEERKIYLTFYLSGLGEEAGKIVFICPYFAIKNVTPTTLPEIPLSLDYFASSLVKTDIIVGFSRISLDDVKNLDAEDIVILENSNLYSMLLKDYNNLRININPDPNIVINLDNDNGEESVSKVTGNIWDSLEVDMSAEFEKVKIRLGDLRNIVEGLVVDVAPIASNKLFLNVDGKQVAVGELVIIEDKYGVKITKVFSDPKKVKKNEVVPINGGNTESISHESYQEEHEEENISHNQSDSHEIDDSDFDFSDYEIEDDV